ncbi:MAG: universal stress protein [Actinomycetota bacterium]|nr:universal stress protein [Actinomycetota bacterium]
MNTSSRLGSVVVGVDGSIGSDEALEWAAGHAASKHRSLLVLNGAGDPGNAREFLGSVEAERVLLTAATRVTDHAVDVVRRVAPDLDVQVATPLQDPREALLDASTRASMVVVGTRGRGPVMALLLGSVSSAVAAHASCPVAVIRATESDQDGKRGHVVVGVGPASTAALEFAFDTASTEGRSLDVVHSWSTNDTFVDRASFAARLAEIDEHERLLGESLAGYAEKYPDVPVTRQTPDARPVQTLVRLSEEAALVVVGSRGRTGLKATFGSVSREVAERAHCTVVVVGS